jgi:hypothetical protein
VFPGMAQTERELDVDDEFEENEVGGWHEFWVIISQ